MASTTTVFRWELHSCQLMVLLGFGYCVASLWMLQAYFVLVYK